MEPGEIYTESCLHDPSLLAQRLLEQAYRADAKIACGECFSGGSIAARLGSVERHRNQFAGAFILNCDEAIAKIIGKDASHVRGTQSADLALSIARTALRGTGADLAMGVVAPRGAMRFGAITFAVANGGGKFWLDEASSARQPEREIIAHSFAFFLDCLSKSERSHY